MNFIGRILLTVGVLFISIYRNIVLHTLGPFQLFLTLVYCCIAWWIGEQSDTARIVLKELKVKKNELEESEKRYRTLIENSPEPILVHTDGRIVFVNQHGVSLLGAENIDNLVGMSIYDFMLPEFQDEIREVVDRVNKTNESSIEPVVLKIKSLKGNIYDIEASYTPISFNDQSSIYVNFRNVTIRKRVERELKKSNERFEIIFEKAGIGLILIDRLGKIITTNPFFEKIVGYSAQELSKMLLTEFIHPDDLERDLVLFHELVENNRNYFQVENRLVHKNGENIWVNLILTLYPQAEDDQTFSIGMAHDITENKKYQTEIYEMAFHDALTGLPNRYLFNEFMQKALDRGESIAVMFLDLDRFKLINDTFGHDLGDVLLIEAGKRLAQSVRKQDIVARQGGDEFIILLEGTGRLEAEEAAKKIMEQFTEPFLLEGEEVFTSPSIGISLYPRDGSDLNTLKKNADAAMYLAKKCGRNNYQFYIQEDEEIINRKLKLERELKRALMNKQFALYYQPKVELNNRKIYGFEALLRWNHPSLGSVSPQEFIPIAEDAGMIIPIGKWVLREACRQVKEWHNAGIFTKMAVNVSTIQIEDLGFIDFVKDTLLDSGVSPEYLGLEITESVMQNIRQAGPILQSLQEIGIKVSIDDFGTGYSSLSVLNKVPIDLVKIDKSFISEILTNPNTASLVKTMIQMAENLNFKLVAEGIETEQQLEFLIQNGCKYGQGYYFSPPLPAEDAKNLILKQV
jgi:diguanylate cyclase (GGDEF)-like protein/PAS domain S-box-containing protein